MTEFLKIWAIVIGIIMCFCGFVKLVSLAAELLTNNFGTMVTGIVGIVIATGILALYIWAMERPQ